MGLPLVPVYLLNIMFLRRWNCGHVATKVHPHAALLIQLGISSSLHAATGGSDFLLTGKLVSEEDRALLALPIG